MNEDEIAKIGALLGMDRERLERFGKGQPFVAAMPAIPLHFYLPIGQLAIAWASFERRLNDYVMLMTNKELPRQDESWRGQPFNRRLQLFRKHSDKFFGDSSTISRAVTDIVEEARDMHGKRSAILHAFRSWSPDNGRLTFARKKHSDVLEFDLDDLKDLACRAQLLSGQMSMLFTPQPGDFGLSESDAVRLRTFAESGSGPSIA